MDSTHQMQLYRRKSEDLQIEKLLAGSKRPHPLHDDYCSARAFAVNPSRLHQAQDQAAQGRDLSSLATLRASGVDCSARPSKESYHAMNADTCLVCSRPTSSDRKKAKKISLRRKISLTRRASYKPPALPGDTYWWRRISKAQGRRREAGSEGSVEQSRGPMDKNRIRGLHNRTSEPMIAKSTVIKDRGGHARDRRGGQSAPGSGQAFCILRDGSWRSPCRPERVVKPEAPECEARAAKTEVESRAAEWPSMEVITEQYNLRKAFAQVKRNMAGRPMCARCRTRKTSTEHGRALRARILRPPRFCGRC